MKHTLTLWKNPKGGVYYLCVQVLAPDNIQHRKSLRTKDQPVAQNALEYFAEHEADAYVAQLIEDRAAKERGASTTSAPNSLASLVDWFIRSHMPYVGRRPKTIQQYMRVLGSFQGFCESRDVHFVEDISSRIVQEWQSALDSGLKTKRRDDLVILKTFLFEACEMNNFEPPSIRWNIPSRSKGSKFKALTEVELKEFLELVRNKKQNVYDAVEWIAHTGWRSGDVFDLRWNEVFDEHIDRAQLKTENKMMYPISPAMREILKRQDKSRPRVFCDGDPREDYKRWQQRLATFCNSHYHRNVAARDLRKTFGTLQAKHGCPPHLLRELMGHKSVKTTLSYYVESDLESMSDQLNSFGSSFGLQSTTLNAT